jgi:RNA polymerase sigma-70 factor (ECF subfamily)
MDDHERLLAGVRRADQVILGEIYELYSPEIFRYAWRLLGNEDVAEECVADTFSRFLKAIKNGSGPHSYLKAYLYRTAHNWIHDYWVNSKDIIGLIEVDNQAIKGANLEDGVDSREDIIIIRQALNQLTADQQSVIVLKYIEELDNLEIARIIKKPVGAIKALQHRGLNSLRRLLSKQYNSDLADESLPSTQKISLVLKEE